MGRLLDAYDKLQAAPFGELSRQNSDPGLRQMRSQRGALTSALRTGIRKARRDGNAEEVLKNQTIGNQMGLETSGIGSRDLRVAGDAVFERNTEARAGINRDLSERAAAGVAGIGQQADAAVGLSGPTVDEGTGDRFVSRIESSPTSFAEQEKAKQQASAAAGNFGSMAQGRANRQGAAALLDEAAESAVDYEIGDDPETGGVAALPKINDKKASSFVDRAIAMGGTADSFRDALRRRTGRMGGVRPDVAPSNADVADVTPARQEVVQVNAEPTKPRTSAPTKSSSPAPAKIDPPTSVPSAPTKSSSPAPAKIDPPTSVPSVDFTMASPEVVYPISDASQPPNTAAGRGMNVRFEGNNPLKESAKDRAARMKKGRDLRASKQSIPWWMEGTGAGWILKKLQKPLF